MRPHAVWSALIGAGVAYEAWALRHDHNATLSACTRSTFRTDTRAGQVAFTAAWVALTTWFVPHIARRPVTPKDPAPFNR